MLSSQDNGVIRNLVYGKGTTMQSGLDTEFRGGRGLSASATHATVNGDLPGFDAIRDLRELAATPPYAPGFEPGRLVAVMDSLEEFRRDPLVAGGLERVVDPNPHVVATFGAAAVHCKGDKLAELPPERLIDLAIADLGSSCVCAQGTLSDLAVEFLRRNFPAEKREAILGIAQQCDEPERQAAAILVLAPLPEFAITPGFLELLLTRKADSAVRIAVAEGLQFHVEKLRPVKDVLSNLFSGNFTDAKVAAGTLDPRCKPRSKIEHLHILVSRAVGGDPVWDVDEVPGPVLGAIGLARIDPLARSFLQRWADVDLEKAEEIATPGQITATVAARATLAKLPPVMNSEVA